MIQWFFKNFSELTPHELYDILALREQVFSFEQNCLEPDLDFRDQHCVHLLGKDNGKIVTYLRILPKNTYPDAVGIGRVVTAKEARGKGIGRQAMDMTLAYIQKHNPGIDIIISAQLYLENFYASLGFHSKGQPYEEAGIKHIKMIKKRNEK